MTLEALGWCGACLFAVCGLPQAFRVYRRREASDLSVLFLLAWGGGEALMLLYAVLCQRAGRIDLAAVLPWWCNYAANLIVVDYLLYARLRYPPGGGPG